MKAILARAPVVSFLVTVTAKWQLPAATGTQGERSHTAPEAARAKECLFFALLLSWVELVARLKPQISAADPFMVSFSLVNGKWMKDIGVNSLG